MASYTYTNSRDNAPLARYIDAFTSYDFGPSNGERRHAVVASGSFLLPWDLTLGVVWTGRSPLPGRRRREETSIATASTATSSPARRATRAAAT